MTKEWKDGLCREYVNSLKKIFENNRYGKNDFNLTQIGFDVIELYREMFEEE